MMKRLAAVFAVLCLFIFTGCEAKNEVDDYMDKLENCAVRAEELPEEYYEVPDDWVRYSFDCGVVFRAPAGLSDVSRSEKMQVFADADSLKERTYSVIKAFENDWEERNEENEDEMDPAMRAFGNVGGKLGISYAYLVKPGNDALRELGYEADTRYDLCKSLLTITDEELEKADKKTAKAIRIERGKIFQIYLDEAYIIEKENAHVFIHRYADDSYGYGRYFVNVMPTDDFEYSLIIKAPDLSTALRIAASADIAP